MYTLKVILVVSVHAKLSMNMLGEDTLGNNFKSTGMQLESLLGELHSISNWKDQSIHCPYRRKVGSIRGYQNQSKKPPYASHESISEGSTEIHSNKVKKLSKVTKAQLFLVIIEIANVLVLTKNYLLRLRIEPAHRDVKYE